MFNLLNYTSLFSEKFHPYNYLNNLTSYNSSSFIFSLYYNSFCNSDFNYSSFFKNEISNAISLNSFSFNDIDNKEFCCLFILTVLNFIIGFFPNSVFYYVDFYVSDLIFFINY
jgi:hypothetical protein